MSLVPQVRRDVIASSGPYQAEYISVNRIDRVAIRDIRKPITHTSDYVCFLTPCVAGVAKAIHLCEALSAWEQTYSLEEAQLWHERLTARK